MKTSKMIVPQIKKPAMVLPGLEQFPRECQAELIQALAALLLRLPQLQAIEQMMTAGMATDRGARREQRE